VSDSRRPNEFKSIFLQAIDKGLLVLGGSVGDSIFYYLESKYHLRREQVPEQIEDFHMALEGLFGGGATVIEKLIARNLCDGLGVCFEEHDNWTLLDYVSHARKVANASGK